MRYNLHTHTYRCNHASGTGREYVEAAIKAGMKTLGFADHCPQFFPNDYYSTFRMRPEAAADYVESLRTLKKEYKDDIEILIGFETEYYPAIFDKFREFIAPLDLDYMIMGQHFIHNEYEVPNYYASNPTYEDAKQYVRQTEYCRELKDMDIPVEYNILGYRNKKWYPNALFWQVVAEVGNRVVLGYDAHEPGALLEENNYDACMGYLNMLGITPIQFRDIEIRRPNGKIFG